MSYTKIVTVDKATLASDFDAAGVADEHDGEHASGEMAQHLAAARDAAAVLARVVGVDTDRLVIEVSGHANPGHGLSDGLSNEVVSVTVRVVE